MNNTLRRACTGVYIGNISEKMFTLCINTTVSPYGSLICKKWFSGRISMSWFDSQLQLLRYSHWKLRKSRLTVSLINLLAGCQLVFNVTCCLLSEVRLLFLLHFWTDLAGLRKNVTCPFSNKPKLTELKISKVLLASSTKMLTKFSKPERQIFQGSNWVRLLLDTVNAMQAFPRWEGRPDRVSAQNAKPCIAIPVKPL